MEKVRLSKCHCGSPKRPVVNYLTDDKCGIAYACEIYCTSCEVSTEPYPEAYSAADAWNSLVKTKETK